VTDIKLVNTDGFLQVLYIFKLIVHLA